MKNIIRICLLVGLALAGCQNAPDPAVPNSVVLVESVADATADTAVTTTDPNLPTVAEIVSSNSDLAFFYALASQVGLYDFIESRDQFTLLAPVNSTFTKAGILPSTIDPTLAASIVQQQMLMGILDEQALETAVSAETFWGETVPVMQLDSQPQIDYVRLTGEVIPAQNGIVYLVEDLLLPAETAEPLSMWGVLQADGRFTTLVTALKGTAAMYQMRVGGMDAFLAPTDDAFAALSTADRAYLLTGDHEREALLQYLTLSPDGWPNNTPFTLADMQERGGEIPTAFPINNSGFGSGFEKHTLTDSENGLMIDTAAIIEADLLASNGIIHVIDTVLIPDALAEHLGE